jgi:hypothetical protein
MQVPSRATTLALRQAGSAATAEQRDKIEALVAAIYRERDATEATAEASMELRDIGRDVLGGVISDLRAGADEAEIFAGVIDKLADRMANLALDSLFGGAGGAGILGSIGKLFGFAQGGFTGNGGKMQPAGVVHKGEYVFSKKATDRIGAGNLESLHRGFANGGILPATDTTSFAAPLPGRKRQTQPLMERPTRGQALNIFRSMAAII